MKRNTYTFEYKGWFTVDADDMDEAHERAVEQLRHELGDAEIECVDVDELCVD